MWPSVASLCREAGGRASFAGHRSLSLCTPTALHSPKWGKASMCTALGISSAGPLGPQLGMLLLEKSTLAIFFSPRAPALLLTSETLGKAARTEFSLSQHRTNCQMGRLAVNGNPECHHPPNQMHREDSPTTRIPTHVKHRCCYSHALCHSLPLH